MSADTDWPSWSRERGLGPAEPDIDHVAPIDVDRMDGFNFRPLEMPRHQSPIKDSALINRDDHRIGRSPPAETMQEDGNPEKPRQTSH
jgi:hypothetical protein